MKRPILMTWVIGSVASLLVAAQATAHFREPSNTRRLKHDLRHLDGFLTDLVGNTFVDGKARVLRAKAVRDTGGTVEVLRVPGMGLISLVKDGPLGVDCIVTWKNESGKQVLRTGWTRNGANPMQPLPVTTDARIEPNSTIDVVSTEGQLESGSASQHISTSDYRRIMIVDVALHEGIPPQAGDGCATTVLVTLTTL